MRRPLRTDPPARRGVSLVELLVVMTIIAILAALTIGALGKAIDWVKHSNTERTISKVFKKLDDRLLAIATAKGEPHPAVYRYVAASRDERERAQVIHRKLLYKIRFPMSYAEVQANAASGDPLALALWKDLQSQCVNKSPLRSNNPETEPGACLALILAQMQSLDEFSPSELIDTDGDGVKEVCDAWGKPLRFFRWPTADLRVERAYGKTPPAGQPGVDFQDPTGLLNETTWRQQYGPLFERDFHRLEPPPRLAVYAPLVIASAGPDGKFGIVWPPPGAPDPMALDPANAGDELDNLYSFRLRLAITGQ
jgi:prepilin-type N-terminal cleavage/methylation domain-containing protein